MIMGYKKIIDLLKFTQINCPSLEQTLGWKNIINQKDWIIPIVTLVLKLQW